jgi:hypothetical protein
VGQDAALQVTAKLALDVGRDRVAVIEPVGAEREPSREVRLHGAVQQGALQPPPVRDGNRQATPTATAPDSTQIRPVPSNALSEVDKFVAPY